MSFIYLYTGEAAGKTTSTLGVALRMIAHNKKVIIIQFMKGKKDIGEIMIKDKLGENYEIHQFGREGWVDLKNPSEEDKNLAAKGLEFAKESLKKEPDLLILDEINIAVATGLLNVNAVLDALKEIPEKTHVYMTGRYAPKELIERADYAIELKQIKMPSEMPPPHMGIEY